MSSRTDPSALRWLIGAELSRYRREVPLSLSELAAATNIGKPKLGHMETGRYQQFPDDIATGLAPEAPLTTPDPITPDLTTARWFTSSRSTNNGDCVECAYLADRVAVRDSKDRSGPTLFFDRPRWAAFLAATTHY